MVIFPGLATCPVLFAAEEFAELNKLISRRFSRIDDVYLAHEIVLKSQGVKRSRELANQHITDAINLVGLNLRLIYGDL